MLLTPVGLVAAQSTACPIAADSTVSQAVGATVAGSVDVTIDNMTICSFKAGSSASPAFGVSREMNVFGPAEGGPAALAQRYLPNLPDAARAEIDALSQAGIPVATPGDHQFEVVSGVGDSALWVQTELVAGFFKDSLLVQRGADAFSFDVDDSPDARAALTALAQAVVAQPAP